MQPLERVFKDADTVALSSLVSTVQIPGGPGPATQASPANTAAVSMFDDDLDVGAPAAVSGVNRCDILFQSQHWQASATSKLPCKSLHAGSHCCFFCPVDLCLPCPVYVPWLATCPPPAACPALPCPPLPALPCLFSLPCPALPCPACPANPAHPALPFSILMSSSALPCPYFPISCVACRPTSAGPASASLATNCRQSCLSLITSLGMLDPNAAITILLHLLHHSGSSSTKPPPELVHRALHCLCDLVATAEGSHHIRQATAALIGEPDGLLAHHRFQRDEVLMVLQMLSQLAKTFLSQHGSSSGAGQSSQ